MGQSWFKRVRFKWARFKRARLSNITYEVTVLIDEKWCGIYKDGPQIRIRDGALFVYHADGTIDTVYGPAAWLDMVPAMLP
jgi:hypothetical protein